MFALTWRGPKMFSGTPNTKISWFDRSIIKTKWPKFNKNPLQKAGNLTMRIARGSIKRRLKKHGKPSRPGSPPYSRKPGATPPFKMIFSVPFKFGTSVIVGMVGFGGSGGGSLPPPGLQEHGGSASRRVFSRNAIQNGKRRGRRGRGRTTYKQTTVHYPERPFMRPALFKARSILPSLWLNSVSSG